MGGVTGDKRTLHSEALHYLDPHPILAVQIKDNDMGRACSTHVGGKRTVYRVLSGKHERDHLEDVGVGGSMI